MKKRKMGQEKAKAGWKLLRKKKHDLLDLSSNKSPSKKRESVLYAFLGAVNKLHNKSASKK